MNISMYLEVSEYLVGSAASASWDYFDKQVRVMLNFIWFNISSESAANYYSD